MKITTKKHVNRRERIGGFVYVLLFFCGGVSLAIWLIFSDNDVSRIFSRKDSVEIKMARQHKFRKAQEENAAVCDMLMAKIADYDPSVNALYEKNEIQYIINELRKHYENNNHDKRYLVFLHMGDFYQMWFNDRQHLWSLNSNLNYLRNNLEECELGLEKKKETMKI